MIVLSLYKINQMNGIIPNLDKVPEFTMQQSGNEIKYFYQSYLLLTLIKDSYYNTFSGSYSEGIAIDSGLFSGRVFTWTAVYDALYYKCNEYDLKLDKKTSEQLQKVIHRLRVRLSKQYESHGSWYTSKVLNTIIDFFSTSIGISKPTESSTLDEVITYIEAVKNIALIRELGHLIRFNLTTLQWTDTSSSTPYTIRGTMVYAKNDECLIQRYNLVKTPGRYGRYYYINPETEVYIDGTIYLATDIQLTQCPTCGTTVQQQHIIDDGCKHCLGELSKIHNYSTKVPELLKFKANKVKPTTLYLGAELEYESTSSTKERDAIFTNKTLRGHAILKSDGSIQQGFEIVTCPATLDIHLTEFKVFFATFKEKTKLHGDKNTGMHVHISRKPLGQLTVGKMNAFLNNDKNKSFIETIAGRKLNTYCMQDTKRTVTHALTYGAGARYNALNLNNDQTVELRIFSTPETYDEFAYKMEFADALANFCNPYTVNLSVYEALDCNKFIAWAMTQRHTYPHLVTKLKSI